MRRESIDRAGLSVLLDFMPICRFTDPWVLRLTPPGPKIFSRGPRAKFMSSMLNGSLSGLLMASELRSRK